MFKLSAVQARLYEFEHPDDNKVLHIRPPKLDCMEIFNKVFTDTTSDNEEGVRITAKQLMYWANVDQLSALVDDFLGWLNKTKADNPN